MTAISGLSAMRSSMLQAAHVAEAQGVTEASSSSILATGGDFLAHAQEAVRSLDSIIDERTKRRDTAARGGASDEVLAHDHEQVSLLTALRDRIQLSIERIGRIVGGMVDADSHTRYSAAKTLDGRHGNHPVDLHVQLVPHTGVVLRAYAGQ